MTRILFLALALAAGVSSAAEGQSAQSPLVPPTNAISVLGLLPNAKAGAGVVVLLDVICN